MRGETSDASVPAVDPQTARTTSEKLVRTAVTGTVAPLRCSLKINPAAFLPRRLRQTFLSFAICAGWALLAGCASNGGKQSASAIQSLHLFSVPVAVNLDSDPGPDGFAVRLFAKGSKSSKGVAIPNGTVEIQMFDGISQNRTNSLPLRTWSFSGSELKKHEGRSAVGLGYRFTLRWEEARPTQSRFSIQAHYVPSSGKAVSSAPSSVTMGGK